MTRSAAARLAGFTFLFYIAVGISSRAGAFHGPAAGITVSRPTLVDATLFAIGSTFFCWLLLRGRMLPRALGWTGMIASVILVVGLLLQLAARLAAPLATLMWMPMLAFEVPAGVWLLAKGVPPSPDRPGRQGMIGIVAALCLIVAAVPARGQYAQPLFLEAARDPGRADVAKTARQLALGGIEAISGAAGEAAVSPGLLTAGTPSVDLVFSFGQFRYARQELTNTAAQLPPRDPARTLSATSSRPVGYFAVAARRARWGVAGFFDASSRYAHAFETRKAPVFGLALFPTVIQEDASGRASVMQSLTRTGGAIAIGGRRAGAGASLYLVHFRHEIDALTSIEIGSSSFSDPVFRTRCCVSDSDRVNFDGWSAGLSVSGHYAPTSHLRFTARWRHDPAFAADRHGSRGQDATVQRVALDLPGALGAGLVVAFRLTIVAAEAAREMYAGTFFPAGRTADPNQICGRLRSEYSDYCYGWNFPYHDTRDVTVLRTGIEHAVPAGRAHLLLRAGIAREPGYTLARDAADPSTARSFEFPAPPIVTPFEPPREDLTWLSVGGAWSWPRAEIGVGLGWADNQKRVLVDFRLHR